MTDQRTQSPILAAVCAAVLAPLLTLSCGAQASPDEGAFVVRLGTDTTAVERYRFAGDRMEAVAVTRVPRTLVQELTLEWDPDGRLTRYEMTVRDPSAPADAPPESRTAGTVSGDSVTVETTADGETRTRTTAAAGDVIPRSFTFYSLEQLAVRRALAEGLDTVRMLANDVVPVAVRRSGADSVALETPDLGTWRAAVDEQGRILGMHAGALGRDVERVALLDVEALAERYAALDEEGRGMGPLSPRDTARGTVHGASIAVDYGRPSKRGRTVFGGLVPWGEVWRTGANQATHLTTDRALVAGGTTIPAGTYTLYTIPSRDGWTLVVNEQTGQAGTAYDAERDLARLALDVSSPDRMVERFTIAVEETADGGLLKLTWDRTEASLPFTVAPGA